jgi:hypothetical protein
MATGQVDLVSLLRSLNAALTRLEELLQTRADQLHDMRREIDAEVQCIDDLRQEVRNILEGVEMGSLKTTVSIPNPSAAEPDVFRVKRKELDSGSTSFSFNTGKTVILRPRLAQLFQFLGSGPPEDNRRGALVGWRSRLEISAYFEKCTGKPFTIDYVNHLVYCLRNELAKAGCPRKLVQSHRARGVRLAIPAGALLPPERSGKADSRPV